MPAQDSGYTGITKYRIFRPIIFVNNSERFGISSTFCVQHGQVIKFLLRFGKIINLVACCFTFAAADAAGSVKKYTLTSGITFELLASGFSSCGRAAPTQVAPSTPRNVLRSIYLFSFRLSVFISSRDMLCSQLKQAFQGS